MSDLIDREMIRTECDGIIAIFKHLNRGPLLINDEVYDGYHPLSKRERHGDGGESVFAGVFKHGSIVGRHFDGHGHDAFVGRRSNAQADGIFAGSVSDGSLSGGVEDDGRRLIGHSGFKICFAASEVTSGDGSGETAIFVIDHCHRKRRDHPAVRFNLMLGVDVGEVLVAAVTGPVGDVAGGLNGGLHRRMGGQVVACGGNDFLGYDDRVAGGAVLAFCQTGLGTGGNNRRVDGLSVAGGGELLVVDLIVTTRAGLIGIPADLRAGRSLCIVVHHVMT